MRSLSLALSVLLAAPAAYACPEPQFIDVPLTANGATLLDDGGVVIETRVGRDGLDPAVDGLRLTSDGKDLAARQEAIAPMLTMLRPPRGDGRKLTAVDGNKKVVLTLTQAKATKALTAPKPGTMTSTLPRAIAGAVPPNAHHGVVSSAAELTLSEAAPADVIAIVVYTTTKQGTQGIAWFKPTAKQLVYKYSTGGKGCIPGPSPLRQGDKIALGFVDSHGRTSPRSTPMTVAAPARPKQ